MDSLAQMIDSGSAQRRPALLDLPPEIRGKIWKLALTPCELFHPAPHVVGGWGRCGVAINHYHNAWHWGTYKMTRLLRVSRQVHNEACRVLYSKFDFNFALNMEISQIEALHKKMLIRWRESIRTIIVNAYLDLNVHNMEQWLDKSVTVFTGIRKLVPNVTLVKLYFKDNNSARPTEDYTEEIVKIGLKLVKPFRGVSMQILPTREIPGEPKENAQRLKICQILQERFEMNESMQE